MNLTPQEQARLDAVTAVYFCVYDGASGMIYRSGTCARSDVPLQAIKPGEVAMETAHPCADDLYRIDNGTPVPLI